MAGSSGAALGTGEASALSPRSPNLSTELSALMQRVEQYDAVAQQRDALAAALAAAQATVRDLEARTVQYPFLATQHAEAVAENRQLKAQQLLLEEDARKNKPLRDAVVRELQVCVAGHMGRWKPLAVTAGFGVWGRPGVGTGRACGGRGTLGAPRGLTPHGALDAHAFRSRAETEPALGLCPAGRTAKQQAA